MKDPKDKNALEITHVRGSGPGGQNRNKRFTGVRIEHKPTGTTVRATERRSQAMNLAQAFTRLEEKLEKLSFKPKARRKTKKTKSSQKRRMEGKRKVSSKKQMRQRVRGED